MGGVFDGASVLVAGAGISGLAAARVLLDEGALVWVSDDDPARLTGLPDGARPVGAGIPDGVALVVTSPGRRPDHPLVRRGRGPRRRGDRRAGAGLAAGCPARRRRPPGSS